MCGNAMMCNGKGQCVSAEMNPCEEHGCDEKECGDECLSGDITGVCNMKGERDYSNVYPNCPDKVCSKAGCGIMCGNAMMCNGKGQCVSAEMNPCEEHGCDEKECGDECLSGDIMGVCNMKGECDYSNVYPNCPDKVCSKAGCGIMCGNAMMCNGKGQCVSAEM